MCVVVHTGRRLIPFTSPVDRARGRLRMWRSRARPTRKPNPWRLVSIHQRQLYFESEPFDDFRTHRQIIFFLFQFSTAQLAAAREASRPASRTSPSRRRRRTGRGPRRSERVDRPRRSRSRRRRAVKSKRRPRPRLQPLLQVPVPVQARHHLSSQIQHRHTR